MIYRGRGLRPYSIYERRRNPRFAAPDIAFQPVEADKREPAKKEAGQETISHKKEDIINDSFGPAALNERLGSNSRCPHICRIFNIDVFLDDLILLGLIFLLIQEKCDDYIFIAALVFLFLTGKE